MSGGRISVIVPVLNAEATMRRCLEAIFASETKPHEVVVIDDGCTDRSIELAREFPCRVVRGESPGGVAAARNLGARETSGEILFFTDADVILMPCALGAAAAALEDRSIDVAVGLQSARSEYRNPTSIYKNLWLRYTYMRRAGRFSVLYSSAVAIRRTAFDKVGGFDLHYQRPNIEDSELGKRLSEAGCALALVPELEFLHVKRYDHRSMLKTDFLRTVGMMKVQLRDRFRRARRENYTSIPTPFLVSCLVPWLVPILILIGVIPAAAGWPSLLIIPPLLIVLLNLDWLRYLIRLEGPSYIVNGTILLHLDVAAVNAGLVWGVLDFLRGKKY